MSVLCNIISCKGLLIEKPFWEYRQKMRILCLFIDAKKRTLCILYAKSIRKIVMLVWWPIISCPYVRLTTRAFLLLLERTYGRYNGPLGFIYIIYILVYVLLIIVYTVHILVLLYPLGYHFDTPGCVNFKNILLKILI
jgi:hypothetical protein